MGDKVVRRSSRIIFNWDKVQKNKEDMLHTGDQSNIPIKKYNLQKGRMKKISDLLRELDTDITSMERYIASMSNSSDVVLQLVDKATKEANKIADDKTIEIQNGLEKLRIEMNKKGY